MIQGRDANVIFSKKEELERAATTWAKIIGKEVLES